MDECLQALGHFRVQSNDACNKAMMHATEQYRTQPSNDAHNKAKHAS
jgi:hypothetical protein